MILSSSNLSATTAAPSIFEDINFWCNTDSTQFPNADKLRSVNLWHYDVVTDILAFNSNWEWDSTNKTDFPIGTTTLVDSQRDYALPSDFLKLLRVEVLDVNGNYQKLEQFDESQVDQALSEFQKTNGLPRYYREIANSIELYPKPATGSVTMSAGLKVYYQRTFTEFTNADASVAPGFSPLFHRILSLGASYDWCVAKGQQQKAVDLKNKIDEMREALKAHYSSRNREVRPKLQGLRRNYD